MLPTPASNCGMTLLAGSAKVLPPTLHPRIHRLVPALTRPVWLHSHNSVLPTLMDNDVSDLGIQQRFARMRMVAGAAVAVGVDPSDQECCYGSLNFEHQRVNGGHDGPRLGRKDGSFSLVFADSIGSVRRLVLPTPHG